MKDAARAHRGTDNTPAPTPSPRQTVADTRGRHKGDYSDDVQAGERRQRFFRADGFFAAGFALDFFLGASPPSGGATTVLMTPRR